MEAIDYLKKKMGEIALGSSAEADGKNKLQISYNLRFWGPRWFVGL